MEKIFTYPISDRGLVSDIYRELKELGSRETNNPIKKCGTELNKEFSTEKYQMAEKHLKKCSASLIITETKIKTTLRFHLTLVRMAKIKNSGDSICFWGCWERGTLLHCWWAIKHLQPLWKSVWWFPIKVDIVLPEYPIILLLGIYPEDVPICNKDTNSTMFIAVLFIVARSLKKTQISFNRGMDTENVVHLHNWVLLSY